MGKNKSSSKEKGKSSQLVIRIDKAERTAFVSLCEALDTSAAREIRRFMREFVAANAARADTGEIHSVIGDAAKPVVAEAAVAESAPLDAGPSELQESEVASEKLAKARRRVKA
ncbi:MAG: hypothetical protein NTX73_19480 [Rhodobacterales bacterium]|nr:hypothetical protein [Rhodobacterales bacterium]